MRDFKKIWAICADIAQVDETTCSQDTAQRITRIASTIPMFPDRMKEPRKIEREVDQIIKDIRSLRKRISALDDYARSCARRAADRPEFKDVLEAIADSECDPEAMNAAVQRFETLSQKPRSEWVDFAALHHLDALETAMRDLGLQAIARTSPGAGRRGNQHAHKVAFAAAKAYVDLTGEQPTFWNGGSTPFSRMIERLFAELEIKAGIRGPVEAAMQKLNE